VCFIFRVKSRGTHTEREREGGRSIFFICSELCFELYLLQRGGIHW
jgi:hypothetical protein